MKLSWVGISGAVVLTAFWAGFSAQGESSEIGPLLARRVVRQAMGVREGDRVQIHGTPGDVDLMEDLAVEARKVGAHPLLTVTSDRLMQRFLRDVPEQFDSVTSRTDLALADNIDVLVTIEGIDEGALRGLPASRMTAQQKAAEVIATRMLKRNVRIVYLGNGLYPTATRAKRFGLTKEQLRRVFDAGMETSPESLQATGARLQKLLARGKELHLTSEHGTDLKLRNEGRTVLVSDGVLTPEKRARGGADCMTYLPAGEVYTGPTPGSGDGTVVAPLVFWESQEIRNLRLTFSRGKLTSMTADSGLARLKEVYAAHGPGKENLGVIDLGINPGVKAPKGSKLLTYVSAGTITVAVGNDTWAGGTVSTPFGLNCQLTDATLAVDGKPVVVKGRLLP